MSRPRTKIRAKYLRALENEEFGMLPGPTFVKTFLRTYAEMLGLDPHVLVEEYRAELRARGRARAAAARAAGGGRPRPAPRAAASGPGSVVAARAGGASWRCCVVIGADAATTKAASGTRPRPPRRPRAHRRRSRRSRRRRRRRRAWRCGSRPRRPRTCAWTAASGRRWCFEGTIDAPQTLPRQARSA